ncbi:hypothetical protein Dimus_019378 [Dionaea muscipula]
MAVSALFRSCLSTTWYHHNTEFCSLGVFDWQKRVSIVACERKSSNFHIITSVFENSKSCANDSGELKPARNLLERLFSETQKLEEQLNGSSHFAYDVQIGFNLEILESELQSAIEALKEKEEDLREAEIAVRFEHAELARAKEELEWREREILAACSKQGKLEDELRQANLMLVSHAREIEDLKLRLEKRDSEICTAQSSLSLKECELVKMKNVLKKKSEDAAKTEADLKAKVELLDETNKIVEKQQTELLGLRVALEEKEKGLDEALTMQKLEEEKLKAAEAKLEEKTMQWLLAHDEVLILREEAFRHMGESNRTLDDFRRVKMLLGDLKSELVSSQKSLVSSRQKMEDQELLLVKQLTDLGEQKQIVMSYMTSLKDAQVEVENERLKLRVTEARCKELEQELAMERKRIQDLKEEHYEEEKSLQQAIREISMLQNELDLKNNEFEEMSNLLLVKESELVEARLEIQQLKSAQASLKLVLEKRDLELCDAQNRLGEVNAEVSELQKLMKSKEDELIQAANQLKEKDEYAMQILGELNDVQLKCDAAESVVGRIVDLTEELVVSRKKDGPLGLYLDGQNPEVLLQSNPKNSAGDFRWQKMQLEAELRSTREYLRTKEMEVVAAQRALTTKDEELKAVHEKLDDKEREMEVLKEEMLKDADDLKQLYVLAQARIDGRSVADLALEKLQLEVTQLEVEAATTALHKIVEMSQDLVHRAGLSMELDQDCHSISFNQTGSHVRTSMIDDKSYKSVGTEVARLSALTDQLVQQAGSGVANSV